MPAAGRVGRVGLGRRDHRDRGSQRADPRSGTEANVDANLLADPNLKAFAIDGAIAKARTAALFANNEAPLTSRTVGFMSQSTITQREVESLPFDMDPNSIGRGPGYVAPVRSGGHFPPGVPNTPQVDLFAIEHTNRDSEVHPGADHIKGTADDIPLAERFNIDTTSTRRRPVRS